MCIWVRFAVTKAGPEDPALVQDMTATKRQTTSAIVTLKFMRGLFTTNAA
jgi:hypothetical protein